MRDGPQAIGEHERIEDAMAGPPGALIARLVQGIVVAVAQRHGELIRHLEPEGARLREANVMRLCWPPPAHEARLVGNEGEVRPIADALVFGDEQFAGIWGGRLRVLGRRGLRGRGDVAGFASLQRQEGRWFRWLRPRRAAAPSAPHQ